MASFALIFPKQVLHYTFFFSIKKGQKTSTQIIFISAKKSQKGQMATMSKYAVLAIS
jgi:hypothetical protein